MKLNPPKNHRTKKVIIGRGWSSGRGAQSTKGHKGQKARSGGTILLGYEGGQMPLIRRLPKFGFSNMPHRKAYGEMTLTDLEKHFKDGEEVSLISLIKKDLVAKKSVYVKVIATGILKKKLKFGDGVKFSKKAKEMAEQSGSTVKS